MERIWTSDLRPSPSEDTDAWRILGGKGLGPEQAETRVDAFAGHWLVQTANENFPTCLRGVTPELARSLWWKVRTSQPREAPKWVEGESVGERFPVREHGLSYWIDLEAGYSPGIFLDQRENRLWVREKTAERVAQEGRCRVLNCFAYTGAFSVAAAAAGGVATTLDISQPYLDWARDNHRLNEQNPETHHFCRGDALNWLERFSRQERRFEGVILDPPTFSRAGKGGGTFRVERDYHRLVASALSLLSPQGWLLATTNQRSLSRSRFRSLIEEGLASSGRRARTLRWPRMPPEYEGDEYLKCVRLDVV